jgi:DNA-binding NarL/FixJ family response regulator
MTNTEMPNAELPTTAPPNTSQSNTEIPNLQSACEAIRVLLLNPEESSPVRALIASIPLVHVCRPTMATGSLSLECQKFDVAMIDLPIAVDSAITIEDLHRTYPALPIIVLADRDHEDAALELLRRGASDYLLIEDLDLDSAARALRYALNLSRLRRRVQDLNHHLELANHRLRELFLPATERVEQRGRIVARSTCPGIKNSLSPDNLSALPLERIDSVQRVGN